MKFTPFDYHLHGLLFWRRYYVQLKARYGAGFEKTLAGLMMHVIEGDIEILLKDIDISDALSALEH